MSKFTCTCIIYLEATLFHSIYLSLIKAYMYIFFKKLDHLHWSYSCSVLFNCINFFYRSACIRDGSSDAHNILIFPRLPRGSCAMYNPPEPAPFWLRPVVAPGVWQNPHRLVAPMSCFEMGILVALTESNKNNFVFLGHVVDIWYDKDICISNMSNASSSRSRIQ